MYIYIYYIYNIYIYVYIYDIYKLYNLTGKQKLFAIEKW